MTRIELSQRSNVFLRCVKSFQDFIEGKYYWLEVINDYYGNDVYCVRSDNLLGKQYRFSNKELMENFKVAEL